LECGGLPPLFLHPRIATTTQTHLLKEKRINFTLSGAERLPHSKLRPDQPSELDELDLVVGFQGFDGLFYKPLEKQVLLANPERKKGADFDFAPLSFAPTVLLDRSRIEVNVERRRRGIA
jgi:hypothetical protein